MARKKNFKPPKKHPANKQPPVAGGQNDPPIPIELDSDPYNACDIFLKALILMKELSSRTDHSEWLQQFQTTIFQNISTVITGLQTKQENYTSTIDFVRGIIELSPNRDEFFVNLLKDVSTYGTEYHEMVDECVKVLGLENLIEEAETQLNGLQQNCNAEPILHFMKTWGNGQENVKLIKEIENVSCRRVTEESKKIEAQNDVEVQDEKEFEIKKTTKMVEEEKKESEVQVESESEMKKTTKRDEEQEKENEVHAEMKIETTKTTKIDEEQNKEIEIQTEKETKMAEEQKKEIEIEIEKAAKMFEEQKKENEIQAKRATEIKKEIEMAERQKKDIEIKIQKGTRIFEEQKKENEIQSKRAIEIEKEIQTDEKKKKEIEIEFQKATKMFEEQKKENEIEAKRAIELKKTTRIAEGQKKKMEIEMKKTTKMAEEKKKEIEILAKREMEIKKTTKMAEEQMKKIEIEIEKATKMAEEKKKEVEIHTKKLIEIKKEIQTAEEQKKEIKAQAENEIEMKNATKTDEEQKKEIKAQAENEIEMKNATKTDEEQKKEIKVQAEDEIEMKNATETDEEQKKETKVQAEDEIEMKNVTETDEEQKKETKVQAEDEIKMKNVTETDEEQKKETKVQAEDEIEMKNATETDEEQKKETKVRAEDEIEMKNATETDEEQKKETKVQAEDEIEMKNATETDEEQKKETEVRAEDEIEMKNATERDEEQKKETKVQAEDEIKMKNVTETDEQKKEIKVQAEDEIEMKNATETDEEQKKEIKVQAEDKIEMKNATETDEEQKKEIKVPAENEIEMKNATKLAEEQKKEIEVPAENEIEMKNATKLAEEQKKEIEVPAENEIEMKNATKLAEEQKKEIEAQNKKGEEQKKKNKVEVQKKQNNKDVKADKRKQQSAAKPVQKQPSAAELRKQEAINIKKKDWVISYWNSLSIEAKKDILKIKISDLIARSSPDMNLIISEALSWHDTKKSWEFWDCCKCNKPFVHKESFRLHLGPQHLGSLDSKMKSIMPMGVDNIWSELLLKCPWEPLDASATAKILTDKKKCEDSELVEDTPPQKKSECDQVFKDAWDSSLQKHGFESSLNECDIFEKVTSSGFNESHESVFSYVISKDLECKELLEKIQVLFELLISHKYLGENHLNYIIKFAIEELQGLPIGAHILREGLDQAPLCICFLGQTALTKILKFLKEISQSCGICIYPDKKKDEQVKERDYMFIYADATIILSDYFLKPVDVFLEWIYSSGEELMISSLINDEKLEQKNEIFETLKLEYCHMESFYERKCDYMNYEEAVKSVQDLCHEESKKRKACIEYNAKSYESVLRERREELIEAENVMMFIGSRFELDAITNVLKEVEAQPYDNVDTFINEAIQEQQKHLSDEISKIDARILRSVSVMQQLKLELETVSSHDYESIMFILVNLYLRELLEDLAEKDANKKSEAALKELLADWDVDKKKGGSEKPKGKKKGKQSKKAKGSKVVSSAQPHVPTVDGNVSRPFPVSPDGDAAEVDNAVQKEEPSSKRDQLEAEDKQIEKGIKLLDELQKNSEAVSNVEHLKPSVDQLAKENLDFDMVKNFVAKINDWPEQPKLPLTTSSSTPSINYGEEGITDLPSNKVNVENVQRADRFGGILLQNEAGANNCFLNVIIQSLWHLRRFREEILRRPEHTHADGKCVFCALHDTFASMNLRSSDSKNEAVDPTVLRKAISNLCGDSKIFRVGQMNDASELLGFILKSLHVSMSSSDSNVESKESNCTGSWECTSNPCLVHHLFGRNIFERIECSFCDLKCNGLKYTSFFHNINATALRTTKVFWTESSFEELLNDEMKGQRTCDPDVGGCGKSNYLKHSLSGPAPPHVFTTVLGWQTDTESADDIAGTLAALSTEIDISVLYPGLDSNTHNLVSVVCYGGLHYVSLLYHQEEKCWVMYDGTLVQEIGGWTDVLTLCIEKCFQPLVLFFEASANPKPSH